MQDEVRQRISSFVLEKVSSALRPPSDLSLSRYFLQLNPFCPSSNLLLPFIGA